MSAPETRAVFWIVSERAIRGILAATWKVRFPPYGIVSTIQQTLQAIFAIDGHRRWSAPVGIGKHSTSTPIRRYVVDEKFAVADDPLYGAYAIGTTDYSVPSEWPHGGVIGIHGTNEPQLIPGHPSHGCMRMRNADALRLARHLPIGAPIDID